MATTIIYKYYNIGTHQHQGHPNIFWETESVPLHGCSGVSASIRLYPYGNSATEGYASLYIRFYGGDDNILLKTNATCTIRGTKEVTLRMEISVGQGQMVEFGGGRGWVKFCNFAVVQDTSQVTLTCRIEILEFIMKCGKRITTIYPTGECKHELVK
jgi:hypothetical protein